MGHTCPHHRERPGSSARQSGPRMIRSCPHLLPRALWCFALSASRSEPSASLPTAFAHTLHPRRSSVPFIHLRHQRLSTELCQPCVGAEATVNKTWSLTAVRPPQASLERVSHSVFRLLLLWGPDTALPTLERMGPPARLLDSLLGVGLQRGPHAAQPVTEGCRSSPDRRAVAPCVSTIRAPWERGEAILQAEVSGGWLRQRSKGGGARRTRCGRTGGAASAPIPQALRARGLHGPLWILALGPGRRRGRFLTLGSPPQEDGRTGSRAFSSPCPPPGSSAARRSRRRSASSACASASRPTRPGSCCPKRAWRPPSSAREGRASPGQCPGPQRGAAAGPSCGLAVTSAGARQASGHLVPAEAPSWAPLPPPQPLDGLARRGSRDPGLLA